MLSLDEARRIIRAAENEAARLGCKVNIAVLDGSGHVITHVRMDGAWAAGADEAINKAYTVYVFGIATKDLASAVWAAEGEAGISLGNDSRIVVAAGGIPLRRYGRIVGTIGVSGSTEYGNEMIAKAGARAVTDEYGRAALRPCLSAEPARRRAVPSQIARLGSRSSYNAQPCHQSMLS
jgi:uncharacterized protein GlcG (DUF336 family)